MCHMSSPCQQLSDWDDSSIRELYAWIICEAYSDCFHIGQEKKARIGDSSNNNFHNYSLILKPIWQAEYDMTVWYGGIYIHKFTNGVKYWYCERWISIEIVVIYLLIYIIIALRAKLGFYLYIIMSGNATTIQIYCMPQLRRFPLGFLCNLQ